MLFKKAQKTFEYVVDVDLGKEQREKIDKLYNSMDKIVLELTLCVSDYRNERIITELVTNIDQCSYSKNEVLMDSIYGLYHIITYKTGKNTKNPENPERSLGLYVNGRRISTLYYCDHNGNLYALK